MSRDACPRLFEVEAARDGRLAGDALSRFRSHMGRCPRCKQEARALEALGASLRGLRPVATDELHARRQRARLLAAFDASLLPAPRSLQRWLIPLIAAVAVAALALMLLPGGSMSPAPRAPAHEAIAIRAAADTKWSRRLDPSREIVTLTSGTLSISIDSARSPRRLRVLVPDGELEDLGTIFSVTVAGAATTHVSVQAGSVFLRLNGRPPVVLNAGETWTASSVAAPPSASSPTPSSDSSSAPSSRASAAPVPPRTARTQGSRSVAQRAASEPAPDPDTSPAAPDDAATDFRAALGALEGGDHGLAATLFAGFLAQHPADRRAEDAAYLRVIALQRSGSARATRAAARSYLERHPNGFRRAEVEQLAR